MACEGASSRYEGLSASQKFPQTSPSFELLPDVLKSRHGSVLRFLHAAPPQYWLPHRPVMHLSCGGLVGVRATRRQNAACREFCSGLSLGLACGRNASLTRTPALTAPWCRRSLVSCSSGSPATTSLSPRTRSFHCSPRLQGSCLYQKSSRRFARRHACC
jgi:hypothetical protein